MSVNQSIEELCKQFEITDPLVESLKSKYQLTSSHNSLNASSKQTKRILSIVCLYLTLSEDHKPMTITQICNKTGLKYNEFGKVYNQVMKDFPQLKTESVTIEERVECVLKDANFDPEEFQQLIVRVIQLIRIVRECGLIEGRSPLHIIYGAAFLGWKSLKPSIRSKVKLSEFCAEVSIDFKTTTGFRVKEIFNALKSLGQKIPGKEAFVFNKNNIIVHINDIIKYSSSLLYDLNTQPNGNPSHQWMNKLKRNANQLKTTFETNDSKDDKQNEESISDSEIDCYIRSKREVKRIKKLKTFIESEDQIDGQKERKKRKYQKKRKTEDNEDMEDKEEIANL